ncbi:response regulator [Fulvivirga sediminis]|uniref:histidine kinase n=1 Tax=Fulvivirga sediminis TaxID=2803949 RepID=A0A937FA40_9BACT|nr:response regulator [Fulvivirga sediminis]MBL3658490.1 response regulator [Fulvivirga sediminis]
MSERTKIPSSTSNFEEIVESLEDMIYELDNHGCFKYANASLVKYSGYSKEELQQIPYFKIVKPEQRDELVNFYKNQRDKKQADTYFEFILVAKNGDEIWVGQNVHMSFQDEIVTSIRAVARNINHLKASTEIILNNESQLNELIAHIDLFNQMTLSLHLSEQEQIHQAIEILSTYFELPVGIICKIENDHFHIIDFYTSDSGVKLNAEIGLKNTYCALPYEEKKIISIENTSHSTYEKRESIANFNVKTFIGVPIWVNGKCYGSFNLLSPTPKASSFSKREIEFIWLVCNWLSNVIEKRDYELLLKRQSQLLKDTQNMANIGHWEVDLLQQSIFWSDITKRIHEVEPDFVPTMEAAFQFYDESSKPVISELINHAVTNGEGWECKLGIISAKGNHKWVRTIGSVEWQNEKVSKLIGVFQDFTHEKKQEEELIRAKEEAENASQAKADFLSVMSHEIRTPLNAVIGLAHILLEEKPQDHQLENLNTLKFSAENLLSLINDILDFNKLEAGRVDIEAIDFNLLDTIKGIKQSLVLRAKKQPIDIQTRIDIKVPEYVKGDSTRLSQILNNLTGNALKFTSEGHIIISAHVTEETQDTISIQFSVKDSGIGIANDKHEQIFNKFSQAEIETTRKFGGTGLGLAITKKLINIMGGEIRVESILGEGANFFFTLTFEKSNKKAVEETKSNISDISNESLKGVSILLVEDNIVNQMVATKFLDMWEIQVDTAENGLEALSKVSEGTYDLILMDLQMPEMDGYTASREIRAMGGDFNKIPIIALTASALSDIRSNVLEAGMNDFVSKPFNPKDLFEKISQNLNKELSKTNSASPKPKPKPQFINLAKLEALADKNIPLMIKLLQTFTQEMMKFKDRYIEAMKQKDIDALKSAHHKISPTLKMLEIRLLETQIAKGEDLLSTEDYDQRAMTNNVMNVKQLTNTIIDLCHKKLNTL